MKRLVLFLFGIVAGCSDDDPKASENRFNGDWEYSDSQMSMAFTLTHRDNGVYDVTNQAAVFSGSGNIIDGNDSRGSLTADDKLNVSLNKSNVYMIQLTECILSGNELQCKQMIYIFQNAMTAPVTINDVVLTRP